MPGEGSGAGEEDRDRAEMENVAQLRVPLLAEAKVGASWYEAK